MNPSDKKLWLKTEVSAALGFNEVDEIVDHILNSFNSKEEVQPYLTDLLGLLPSRAQTISSKLFERKAKVTESKQQKPAKMSADAKEFQPLVPRQQEHNSRIKTVKDKSKNKKVMHKQIINCLHCGKIEYNGSKYCSFCKTELNYYELSGTDASSQSRQAQEHMEKLVALDSSQVSRSTVIDEDEKFYDISDDVTGRDGKQPVVLDLDLENRQFVSSNANAHITRNDALSKEARKLIESVETKLDKKDKNKKPKTDPAAVEELKVDDEYNSLFV